jgi:glucan biosynthesis protein C
MLYGLALHGVTIGSTPAFRVVAEVSDHFRMATFFLVSGFFTAMVCSRSSFGPYVKNRARLVLIPLVAGVLLLNPLTIWLIQLFHGQRDYGHAMGFVPFVSGGWQQPLAGPVVWHLHLWFLVSLFVYAMLTPVLLKLADSRAAAALVGRLTALPQALALLLLTLGVGLAVVLSRALNDQLVTPLAFRPGSFIPMATANYLAYFAAGLFAFRHRALFDLMHRAAWPLLLLFGAAYFAQPLVADLLPPWLERVSYWLARAGFIFLIVCTLMHLASRLVTRGSPMLSRLTDGVYTFYIFHFLVIYLIANAVLPFTQNLYLTFALILAVGFPLLFLIHERLIAPSPLLTLLFNGKVTARAVPRAEKEPA